MQKAYAHCAPCEGQGPTAIPGILKRPPGSLCPDDLQGHYVQIAGVSTCHDIVFVVVVVDVPGIELMASHMLGTYSTSDLDSPAQALSYLLTLSQFYPVFSVITYSLSKYVWSFPARNY